MAFLCSSPPRLAAKGHLHFQQETDRRFVLLLSLLCPVLPQALPDCYPCCLLVCRCESKQEQEEQLEHALPLSSA